MYKTTASSQALNSVEVIRLSTLMDILANYDSEDDECKTEQKAEEANINNASKSVNTAAGKFKILV